MAAAPDGDARGPDELSRQEFLTRAGALAAGLAGLSEALASRGWLETAHAAPVQNVRETLDALVAFVVPGNDAHSAAQGTRTTRPGGLQAGATAELIRTLDVFLPSKPPLSSTVAVLLEQTALAVKPGAARGRFRSPFANLSFREKAAVFRRLDALDAPEAGSIRFLAGNLPGLAAFVAYSEAGAVDRRTRRLRRRPTGWDLSRYSGVADGRPELRGYFQNRREAER